jgi:hypothetical protein
MDLQGQGKESLKYSPKLNKYLYGLKQRSLSWHSKLKGALLDRGVVQSILDPCVFISKDMVVLVYVDNCILVPKYEISINSFINLPENGPENVVFITKGTVDFYLGVNIE